MNNPFVEEVIYHEYPMPIIIPSEEEILEEKVKKRRAIRFLRKYGENSRNKELKEHVFNAVGHEPSGLRKPCINVNNVIDYIIRSKYNGVHMTILHDLFGVNHLKMVKILGYSKFEHRIIIKYDEQSNTYFWLPEVLVNQKEESS